MSARAPLLLMSREQVAALVSSRDYLAAMQEAFGGLAQRRYQLPPVGHVPGNGGAFHIKSAVETDAGLAVIKINGNFPGNAGRHGLPTIQGLIVLLDAERGCPLAVFDSIEITARRTAAATALAAKYLANAAADVLAIIGCGVQARYHVEALLDELRIGCVRFFDTSSAAADIFEQYLSLLPIKFSRASSPAAAAHGARIVVTLTTSEQPILTLADIESGAFVAGVGADNPAKHELAAELLQASHVVVDSLAQASIMGDLQHAIRSGAMAADGIYAELADIVVGKIAGRTSSEQRFVFDSTGLAVQDMAAAAMIYRRFRSMGNRMNALDRQFAAGE
jgi:alanine dehydrogenase